MKGQPVMATNVEGLWLIEWRDQGGTGSIQGNVELEELLKVAESMPGLE